VAVLDRNGAGAATIARECGGRAWVADVADDTGIAACAAAIEAELGAVEILVNSAGILQAPLPPQRLPMTTWAIRRSCTRSRTESAVSPRTSATILGVTRTGRLSIANVLAR